MENNVWKGVLKYKSRNLNQSNSLPVFKNRDRHFNNDPTANTISNVIFSVLHQNTIKDIILQ